MIGNLKIYQKWEDMAVYGYICLRQYPKSEKFTLAKETREALWEIGTLIVRANSVTSAGEKRRCIEQVDLQLGRLKVMVRMGMKLEFLPFQKYENWMRNLTEIGKMVGGWLKTTYR